MIGNVRQRGDGPVVLVDDSTDDTLVARRCYERSTLGNPFLSFSDGEDFLGHLDTVAQGKSPMPSLVLLDINMPGKDGFEVLDAVRSQPRFAEMPIVMMLTNSDNPRDIERAREHGADAFQTKPLRTKEYVAFFDSLAPE
jgi:CheY-like chemotaxis protein